MALAHIYPMQKFAETSVADSSLSRRAMASSKKSKEEKEKMKKSKAQETKPRKQENKKAKTSSTKPNNNKKKNGIGNGNVRQPGDEVIITPSSSTDSQEESENEQEKGRLEATNKRKKSGKPKKSTEKREEQDDDDDEDKVDGKVCNFPMRRIRRIIKSQSSDFLIAGDAVFLVNRATDKFLEQFSEDAYACCSKDRKKSVAYRHLASVVSKQRRYDFLSDSVPEKIKAEDALAERKSAEARDR